MMKREDGRVLLDVSEAQFQGIVLALGIAGAASALEGPCQPAFYAWIRLCNDVNEGNPDFIPYELPASIVCPTCGKRSYNPNDIAQRYYCGACHAFHPAEAQP